MTSFCPSSSGSKVLAQLIKCPCLPVLRKGRSCCSPAGFLIRNLRECQEGWVHTVSSLKDQTQQLPWNVPFTAWNSAKTVTTSWPCIHLSLSLSPFLFLSLSSTQPSELITISSSLFVFVYFETGSHRTKAGLQLVILLILLPPCSKLMIFFIFLSGLGVAPRTPCIPGKCSTSVLACPVSGSGQNTLKYRHHQDAHLPQSP